MPGESLSPVSPPASHPALLPPFAQRTPQTTGSKKMQISPGDAQGRQLLDICPAENRRQRKGVVNLRTEGGTIGRAGAGWERN